MGAPTAFGVDVSNWQGVVDWRRVALDGYAWAVAKVTEGTGYADPTWPANRAGIPAAGLIGGGYHFLTPEDPAAQVRAFLAAFGDPAGYLAVLDVEHHAVKASHVQGWVAEWRKRTQHPLGIYTGATFWRQLTGNLALPGCWLWDAGTGNRPDAYVPGAGTGPAVWAQVTLSGWAPYGAWKASDRKALQFTQRGRVGGIAGPVDVDAWLGTMAELRAMTGGVVDAVSTTTPGANVITQEDANLIASTVWAATFGTSPSAGVMLQHAAASTADTAAIVAALVPAFRAELANLPHPAAFVLTTTDVQGAVEAAFRKVLGAAAAAVPAPVAPVAAP